jgi:cobalt/nickel transport system permease protein
MSLITLILAKIPVRLYSQLLVVPLSFALLSSSVVAFIHGTGQTLFAIDLLGASLVVREDGANLALLLISRTFGGMCSLFFIALTTPVIEIFGVLKLLWIPESVIELSMMIYRYIFVFLDQAVMIHNAQIMRLGNAGTKNSLNSFAMLSSVLFLRSWEQGERLMVAMDARCYNGLLNLSDQAGKVEPIAIFAVMSYLSVVAAFVVLTRNIQLL